MSSAPLTMPTTTEAVAPLAKAAAPGETVVVGSVSGSGAGSGPLARPAGHRPGTLPAPGLYENVPFAEYCAWPAVNASTLTGYLSTPLHARHRQTHGKESSALDLGHALHCALLEPAEFRARYALRFRHEKAGSREANRQHVAAMRRRGITELTAAQFEQIGGMMVAVLAHSVAGQLVRDTLARELSVAWVDPETGVPCKARLDAITERNGRTLIADLKTCRSALPRAFDKELAEYGYHVAAAWYLGGLAALQPGANRGWAWIAVESAPPHDVVVYQPSQALLQRGWEKARELLALHLACEREQRWPGYSAEPVETDGPRWL